MKSFLGTFAKRAAIEFDPLTAIVNDLQQLLSSNSGLTRAQLVHSYLTQIRSHDAYLWAFISIAPEKILLQRAKMLDNERKAGKVRGPLHGIPIVLKDNIATKPVTGLDTTGGSLALVHSRAYKNAPLVKKVRPKPRARLEVLLTAL